MTLVEMLVAMAASLVLLGLVAQLFSMLGSGVNGSRNRLELADRLRTVQLALRHDLSGVESFGMLPPVGPDSNVGYLEIIEGPQHEYHYSLDDNGIPATASAGEDDNRLLGDTDDILAFTTRASGTPFVGKLNAQAGTAIQSPYAEVIYFCTVTPNTQNPQMCSLHRRQRIVMAYPGGGEFAATNTAPATLDTDISCRRVGELLVPNTLGDLTKRENRFLRKPTFPYDLDLDRKDELALSGDRFGEDIILTNVIAFDVRVFDPNVELKRIGDIALEPRDPGYSRPTAQSAGIGGAFVDLNWSNAANPLPFAEPFPPASGGSFQGRGVSVLNEGPVFPRDPPTYDTWSSHYETNGVDDDNRWGIDQGLNGVDDNGNGRIDEPAEAETQPPYPVPLLGIEIRIRCYEPSSKQIRQVNIRHAL
jgi:hypothetical protein